MKQLHWYDHISINLFWLGLNIRNTAIGSVFMPYLVASFVQPEIKNTALGVMRTAGLLVAMLVQPAAGILSDRNTSRFGRRRPYIFVGVWLDLIFLIAIGLSTGYWWLFVSVMLIQVSSNISHGPLQGLIPDMVPEEQRGRSSAVKAIFELLPVIIVAFTIAKMVGAGHLWLAIFTTGAALLVIMLITMVLVKEQPLKEKPSTPLKEPMLRVLGMLGGILAGGLAGVIGGGLIGGLTALVVWPIAGLRAAQIVGIAVGGLAAMVIAVVVGVWGGALATLGEDARRHDSFTWWVVGRLMFLAAVTSIQGFAAFFLMSAFGVTNESAIVISANLFVVVGVFTVASALPGGWLADRLGSKRLVGLAGLIAAVGTGVLLITTVQPNLTLMYVAGIIIGLGTGLFTACNWALGTQLVPGAEAGRYLGISNLAGAGAGMVGAGIGGVVADWLNRYKPGLGYTVIFGCYGVLFLLCTISLVRVRVTSAPVPAN
jgi:MFS family permease